MKLASKLVSLFVIVAALGGIGCQKGSDNSTPAAAVANPTVLNTPTKDVLLSDMSGRLRAVNSQQYTPTDLAKTECRVIAKSDLQPPRLYLNTNGSDDCTYLPFEKTLILDCSDATTMKCVSATKGSGHIEAILVPDGNIILTPITVDGDNHATADTSLMLIR